jgi:hypothetical protein
MSADVELAAYLETLGYGTTSAPTPTITVGQMPESPDDVTTLYALPGRRPERTMNGPSAVYERVQIRFRGTDPVVTRAKALGVLTALDGFNGTIGGVRYLFVEALTEVFDTGEDENHRNTYSVTFLVTKERS